ncbi:MAG: hypothetical protein GWO20_19930 [Candidatus Korarchaeota archaeon]|nr:hypothetical protein [Candidatus Korarchaeota archaeon]NIU85502.1 hypothetical protein [Candidatus Thorarchaeota archaeon]NIW15619.1 hypothetical protein [Candidatus Thorarchaeota archaeon]NIW53550.1 hypothetical protein [Candidatus Korarchaeota archaeon]
MEKRQSSASGRAQQLIQQLQVLGERLSLFKQRKREIERALEELKELQQEEPEVYRFIGSSVLIKESKGEVIESLEEELPMIKSQIKTLERQTRAGRQQLGKLLREAEEGK